MKKKLVIHTQFDPAPLKNERKVYDRHDNVDRLSYVDNTTMIKRFVQEGRSLALARAQALRSGQYLNQNDALKDDSGIPTPVYAIDPAVADPIIESSMEKLKTASVSGANEDVKDEVAKEIEAVNDSSTDK